jgi:hypothetical protein
VRQRLFRNGIIALLLIGAAGPVLAQLGVPNVGGGLGGAVERLRGTLDDAAGVSSARFRIWAHWPICGWTG